MSYFDPLRRGCTTLHVITTYQTISFYIPFRASVEVRVTAKLGQLFTVYLRGPRHRHKIVEQDPNIVNGAHVLRFYAYRPIRLDFKIMRFTFLGDTLWFTHVT